MKSFILLIVLTSINVYAETVSFKNQIRFFEKENFLSVSTTPLCSLMSLDIEIQIPVNSLAVQKVHEQTISCTEFKGTLQVFYHQKGTEKYFSQQVTVASQSEVLALCTSYFSLDAKFLVPGACMGRFNEKAVGLSIWALK